MTIILGCRNSKSKSIFTRDTLSFTINKGEVFSYKESEITLHDSLYLQDQTLIIERQSIKSMQLQK